MDKTRFKIYSLLVVKNEADIISASLLDACRWSDKIIVIDNGSTDGTWEIIHQLAAQQPQIIPWLRYEGPFHIGLRAKAFHAFRHEMSSRDWWCVRMDADEFYTGDVRTFLANVPARYSIVKKESTDYVLTQEDIQSHTFSGDFEADRSYITHSLPARRQERRFMRHSWALCWLERWRYPHPWGRTYSCCIPADHYQYRSPAQMEKRFATRQQAKAEGCGSFKHEQGAQWQDYLMTNRQLEEQTLVAHIEQAIETSSEVLYQGRNTLKIIHGDIVVKRFRTPPFPSNLIYGLFRSGKAKRSYEHALALGELTPLPLGYKENRVHGVLKDSYYVCRISTLPLTWRMVAREPDFPNRRLLARAVGVLMAQMHEKGLYALDFSGGNILLDKDGQRAQLVDLNRMRRFPSVSLEKGCRQTRRLHLTRQDCLSLAEGYALTREMDKEQCTALILKHHIEI